MENYFLYYPSINVKKSQAMYFSQNSKLKKDIKAERNNLTINCNDKQMKLVDTVKILGILVDNKLSFSEQCGNISKVNSKTFLLNKSLYLLITFRFVTLKHQNTLGCLIYYKKIGPKNFL